MQLGDVVCDVSIFRSGIVCPVRAHDVLFVKLLGDIGWCRAARHCLCLGVWLGPRTWGVLVKLLGRDVGCIWSSSCLVAGCTFLVGVVKMTGGSELAVASCSDC